MRQENSNFEDVELVRNSNYCLGGVRVHRRPEEDRRCGASPASES